MSKKILIFVSIILMFTMVFAGCGKSIEKEVPAKNEDVKDVESKEEPKQEAKVNETEGETLVISLAHGQPLESAAHKSLELLAKEVTEKTDGEMKIELFPANQLGNERDLAEGLTMGTIDMAWISAGVMENFEQKFAVFSLPFIFRDYQHVHDVAEGDTGKVIFDSLLENKNIRSLQFYDQGFRFIWNNEKPITKLEDLDGIKIRSPESPVYMGTLKLLGSNPTPIPWGELYTSMQTKVVKGFEVFPESVITNNLHEVTKYGSITRHIYAGSVLMINDDIFEKLTEEQKAILMEASKNSEKANREAVIKNEKKFISTLEEEGMEINKISEEEISKFRDAVVPLYSDYAEKVGGMEFLEKIRQEGK